MADGVGDEVLQQSHGKRDPDNGAHPLQQGAAGCDGECLPPCGGLAQGEGGDDGFAMAGADGVQDAVEEAEAAEGKPGGSAVAVLAQFAQGGGEVTLPAVLQALRGKAQRLPVVDERDDEDEQDEGGEGAAQRDWPRCGVFAAPTPSLPHRGRGLLGDAVFHSLHCSSEVCAKTAPRPAGACAFWSKLAASSSSSALGFASRMVRRQPLSHCFVWSAA